MRKGAIDRFEGDIAVMLFDDGEIVNVDAAFLEWNAAQGDVFVYDGSVFSFDREETKRRKESITARFERLKKRSQP
ncbi:hypothetical protein FACS1894105_00060 [Clostridia bacterium]|nr:hypothetical protein FACS1894105_00060 [Clostridia bacterium]